MLPEPFLSRLNDIIPSDHLPDVLSSFSLPRKPSIRVNTLKTTASELVSSLKKKQITLSPAPFWENAFIVEHGSTRDLTDTDEYKNGLFSIQNLSSMLPALVLDPQPGEKVLDLCAAPGSKTTQMAAMMQNAGEIVANDTSKQRLHKLRAQLGQFGITNTRVVSRAGQSLWQKYPDTFDKTLVDVPCSMEGRFQTDDPSSYEHWSEKKVKSLAKLQRWLLRSAISATKPGGVIVYSTCTLSPEENEGVIDWILRKDGHKIALEDILPSSMPRYPSILSWRGKEYHPDVAQAVRVLSGVEWEGFFVARLKRVER